MKSVLPWVLLAALTCAVGFAAFSSSSRPAEPLHAVPAPPLPAGPAEGAEEGDDPGLAQGMAEPVPGAPTESLLSVTGVVQEHKDLQQYTYLRLATDAGEQWAAVYRAPVKDGSTVTVEHASVIQHFHSRELGRDFDSILFGTLPGHETAPPVGPGAPSTAVAAGSVKTEKGAMTIAQLAGKADALEGTQVTVAGHVVKENDGILGRNWIHLQDGTGSEASGTNDLLITGDGTSKVGVDVVASGTVRVRQDFGSGYAYKFMLEHATLQPPPGH